MQRKITHSAAIIRTVMVQALAFVVANFHRGQTIIKAVIRQRNRIRTKLKNERNFFILKKIRGGHILAAPFCVFTTIDYSETIASVGHVEAHVPQSIHAPASIARAPSFSEIAETGHSDSQAPQFTQASVILYAMMDSL